LRNNLDVRRGVHGFPEQTLNVDRQQSDDAVTRKPASVAIDQGLSNHDGVFW
jgi:hypothetical protein